MKKLKELFFTRMYQLEFNGFALIGLAYITIVGTITATKWLIADLTKIFS